MGSNIVFLTIVAAGAIATLTVTAASAPVAPTPPWV